MSLLSSENRLFLDFWSFFKWRFSYFTWVCCWNICITWWFVWIKSSKPFSHEQRNDGIFCWSYFSIKIIVGEGQVSSPLIHGFIILVVVVFLRLFYLVCWCHKLNFFFFYFSPWSLKFCLNLKISWKIWLKGFITVIINWRHAAQIRPKWTSTFYWSVLKKFQV